MEKLKKYKVIIIVIMCVIFSSGVFALMYYGMKKDDGIEMSQFDLFESAETSEISEISDKNSDGNSGDIGMGVKIRNNDDEKIFVHIVGEVCNEGIVELNVGDRIIDAINKAGGVTENANLSEINLAFILSDGQKIRIPSVNDNGKSETYIFSGSGGIEGEYGVSGNQKVNINTANQSELETLSGIGPSLADKIIEFRKKNGKFKKIEDLKNVEGIGESKYNSIKDKISVK